MASCPKCNSSMESKTRVDVNYFLFMESNRTVYEYWECSKCGHKTKEEAIRDMGLLSTYEKKDGKWESVD